MVVKSKKSFGKTRQVKNIDKSKKYILPFYEDKEMQDIMKKYYQIKRNVIILSIFSKIRIDTELKFSTYTSISTTYPMMYHTQF